MALSLQQYKYCHTFEHEIKDLLMERLNKQRKSSLGISIKNGIRLPKDLMIELLSWLPVKDVLQFKSACKLWYSIIESSDFRSKHLKNYYNKNINNWRDCLLVQGDQAHALLLDFESNKMLSDRLDITGDYAAYDICGPCNGIYLLRRNSRYQYLWNPSLNEFEPLPDLILNPNPPPNTTPAYEAYGFGYDSRSKDYKVINIHGYRGHNYGDEYPLSAFIYSLKSNSWRYWGDLKHFYSLRENDSYVFVNGCYYWLGSRQSGADYNNGVVISFDFSMDTFEEIPLPKFKKKPRYSRQLVVYNNSIAFVSVPERGTSFSLTMWNKGVWTKLFSLNVGFEVCGTFTHWWDNMLVFGITSEEPVSHDMYTDNWEPLEIDASKSKNGLVLCDTDTGEMSVLDVPEVGFLYGSIMVYKESLVSIKDFSKKEELKDSGLVCA